MKKAKQEIALWQDIRRMKAFLKVYTTHIPNGCKFNPGVKSDYAVTTCEGHKVNFWFDDEGKTLSYGIVGVGINACIEYEKLDKVYIAKNDSDALNENYLFSCTATDLLCAIVNGQIDPVQLAKNELQNRGFDRNGFWVGFNKKIA